MGPETQYPCPHRFESYPVAPEMPGTCPGLALPPERNLMGENIKKEPRLLGCPDCQACGVWHCSDPLHCGGMRWETTDKDDD